MTGLANLHSAVAAVCPIDGVSGRDPVRIDYRPEATAEQRAAAQAVIAAFDWDRDPMVFPFDFVGRLTDAELAAIQSSADANVIRFRTLVQTSLSLLDMDNPQTVGGLDYLTAIGILAAGRAEQIRGLA